MNDSTDVKAPATTFDYDRHLVDGVDDSIWRALFDDRFRLAARCDVCGRWLTAAASKRAHRGPRCAAKVAEAQRGDEPLGRRA